MKRVLAIISVVSCLILFCACTPDRQRENTLYIRVLCADEEERDRIVSATSSLLAGAENESACERILRERGYRIEEVYYSAKWCGGKFFPAGYYPTAYVGTGERGWQYVAYPSIVYQSMEEFNNAGYGSFLYEFIKKMEERN